MTIHYTKGEEWANTLSHGVGILIGIAGGGYLLLTAMKSGNPWATGGMWLYLFGMLSSYISSTWYHASKPSPHREVLRKFDHASIYLHIAGSYSPIMLIALREADYWGWGIFSFVWLCALAGNPGASPALMGSCAERGISLAFCTPRGRFLARIAGSTSGNVLLRRAQYRTADELSASCRIARSMIFGKVYNARWSIERTRRDHGLRLDSASLTASASHLKELLPQIAAAASLEHLRGLEGAGATLYFGQFDQLILGEKPLFSYQSRSRRPPRDPVNALLSFVYSLLSHDCASALESVGLDSYVGFLHRDRPGRASLALDLMEELRPCMADRFVLTLINNRMVGRQDFDFLENGAVFLSDSGRRSVLKRWQERKKEPLTHPYLQEKLSWGLVPYLQALLLARCLRGDLDAYPPFLWK